MGLETGDRIEDLVDTNPNNDPDQVTQGDDHLRLIKRCLQGSFPSLGAGQVTANAVALSDVSNKLQKFNGRTVTFVIPADDDYSATNEGDGSSAPGKLADFGDWSGAVAGDRAVWDGDKFLPVAPNPLPEIVEYLHADAQGLASTEDRRVYFNGSAVIDTISASAVASVNNDSADGFFITADKPCVIAMSYSDGELQDRQLGIAVNGDGSVSPSSQAAGVLRTFASEAGSTAGDARIHSCSVIMAVDDIIWINGVPGFTDSDLSRVQVVVTEIIS